MKIKHYFFLSFGGLAAAAVVITFLLFSTTGSLVRMTERVRFAHIQLDLLKDMGISLTRMMKEVSDIIVMPGKAEQAEYHEHREHLAKQLAQYRDITRREVGFVKADEKEQESDEIEFSLGLEKEISKLLDISRDVVNMALDGNPGQAAVILEQQLEETFDQRFSGLLDAQIRDEESEIRQAHDSLANRFNRFKILLAATLALLLVFIGTAAWLTMQGILRPIRGLAAAMGRIGQGGFDVRLEKQADNEIGDLADGLNHMAGQLAETQTQLVQSAKLASLGQLSAGVAHELNQPLTVIRMNAQMAARRLGPDAPGNPDLAESLELVIRNADRMRQIINHIRTFSRQSGAKKIPVAPLAMVTEALSLVSEQLRAKGISVENLLPPDLPMIRGNPIELEQVVVNLLLNARDAVLDTGGGADHAKGIRISGACSDGAGNDGNGTVSIRVRDTGPGIPKEDLPKVFDPFFTTKPVGRGTGLGLAVSYGIISAHNGRMDVEKTGPAGTVFRISLPVFKE